MHLFDCAYRLTDQIHLTRALNHQNQQPELVLELLSSGSFTLEIPQNVCASVCSHILAILHYFILPILQVIQLPSLDLGQNL